MVKKIKFDYLKYVVIIFLIFIIFISFFLFKKRKPINRFYEKFQSNENVALVIPIHPSHFEYLYRIINNLNNIDLFLIFSSVEDYKLFKMKDKIKPIIVNVPPEKQTKETGIINVKKLLGLKQLMNTNYEYFILCDAEIEIIKNNFNKNNILSKIKNIFDSKIIYSGPTNSEGEMNIIRTAANVFDPKEIEKIKNETKDFNLYFWYSDLPVYKKEHLKDFLKKIDIMKLSYHHFDYLLYQYWLILNHGFKIYNYKDLINHKSGLEFYETDKMEDLNKLKNINFGFSFVNKKLYDKNKDYLSKIGTFIIFNLDR